MRRVVFVICVMIFNTSVALSQKLDLDFTREDELNYVRMLCYNDLSMVSSVMRINQYCDLLRNSDKVFKIDTILSNGFNGVTFLKVSFQHVDTIKKMYAEMEINGNYIGNTQYLMGAEYFVYPSLSKNEYIFASSSLGLYKLKGFRVNDFYKFYADCFNTGDCFSDENIKANRGKLSDRKIIKSLSVEGLDLWSLYKNFVKGKK